MIRRVLRYATNELKQTRDITQQWRELVIKPMRMSAISGPITIIIDALDETLPECRKEIILLLSRGTDLPNNIRIIITSRPLKRIFDSLRTLSLIRHVSLGDISEASSQRDIKLYISNQLANLLDDSRLSDEDFEKLTKKSEGVFEWACLACEYIQGKTIGLGPVKRCQAVLAGTTSTGKCLLDKMYADTLTQIMPEIERDEAIPVFRSVMAPIILALPTLLSVSALTIMQPVGSNYKVSNAIGLLGSLVTGGVDPERPIQPVHSSFYEFLLDESRSKAFFIDVSESPSSGSGPSLSGPSA
ncbi:hypothetical protein AZE42_05043 [Rhizopogon vesiculosus]|uniref:Nephrocystin 3-like N-terminal domain-containing protein n=1 Tax=Rhizopogon vesiculosus TaxID=180088 RepID=A0A1J8PZ61_9AGAM|nr:hypothetical protein AZE42_05043 [Rhizopogon vesiculosus]